MERVLDQLVTFSTNYGIKIVGAVVILIIGRIGAGIARSSIRRVLEARKTDPSIVSFTSSLAYFTVLTVAVLAALAKFGIQTASFVAVLGAAGFAIGFALQGSLANFAAGVLILVLRPFRVGDYIQGGGAEGTVKEISLFVTELSTLDNIKVLVPNSALFSGNITNLTGYERRRVTIPIGIGYGASIAKARDVAIDVMKQTDKVLDAPAPDVVVHAWGASSVDMTAVCWVEPADYWGVFFALNRSIKEAFDAADIEIPFPQRVVHMVKDDAAA